MDTFIDRFQHITDKEMPTSQFLQRKVGQAYSNQLPQVALSQGEPWPQPLGS